MNVAVGSRAARAATSERGHRLLPPWWLFTTVAFLIWFYVAVLAAGSRSWITAANVAGPLILGLASAASLYRLTRRHSEAIWAPYTWFLLATVLFYSIGPLVYPLGGPQTLERAMSSYPVTGADLLRVNLLDAAGVLSVLLGFGIAGGLSRPYELVSPHDRAAPADRFVAIALVFLCVGGALEYLVILPSALGLYSFVLPGVVRNLADLYILGVMVLAFVVARGVQAWRGPLLILWSLQVAVSFLLFSKHSLILALVLPPIGAYLGHRRIARIIAWGCMAVVVYLSVANLVLWGRHQISASTGTTTHAPLGMRVHIVKRWFDEGMPKPGRVGSASTGWNRLNYVPAQAFAMQRYDSGYPGNTLRYLPVVLIPRVIWPQKPVISKMSLQFYALKSGQHGNYLGLGVFGEGYWDYGWGGVIALSGITGLIFGALGRFSASWMKQRRFEYLPSMFVGLNMGLIGTTQFFVIGVLGAGGFFVGYALLVRLIASALQARRRHESAFARSTRGLPATRD